MGAGLGDVFRNEAALAARAIYNLARLATDARVAAALGNGRRPEPTAAIALFPAPGRPRELPATDGI
eukprot:3041455-Lingulodinium_polyedra.AAC.1